MQLFVRDKSFYKSLIAIAIPIAFQNLISFGVSMLDSIMLGALGDIPLSASSLANQPTFIFQVFVFGVCSGSAVLTAQYWGKRDMDAIQIIFGMAFKVAVVVSVLFSAAMFFFPREIMSIYTDEQPVIDASIEYMRLIAGANLLMGGASVFSQLLRSVEVVQVALAAAIVSLFVNGGMNYALIFGVPALGIPAMGIVGAGIATLIARAVEFVVVIVYTFCIEKKIRLRLSKMLHGSKVMWKDFLRLATPVAFNELMWSLGTSLQAIVIGRMGSAVVSANSIASVVNQLATIFIWGIANAASVLIGKTIGENDPERAKRYSVTLQVMAVITGVIAFFVVLLCKDWVISLYNISDAARGYADQLMIVTAVLVFFVAYTAPCLVGILRGGGDVKFVMIMDIIFLWGFTTPIGFLTGLGLKWAPWIVFGLMKSDEAIKAVIAFFRLRSGKWVRNVTREDIGVLRAQTELSPDAPHED